MANCIRKGFTLVELSIVLVIIGLIIGSVTVGTSLVKSAQLKKQINNIGIYKAAIDSFKDKYDAWPGDFSRASTYWPSAYNGNHNSHVNTVSGGPQVSAYNELAYAWQHLSLSGFVPGNYNGLLLDPAVGSCTPTVNCPAEPIQDIVVWFCTALSTYGLPGANWNVIMLVSPSNLAQGSLSVDDAYQIDKKYDDGDPDDGKMLVTNSSGATGCVDAASTDTSGNVAYDFTQTGRNCKIRIYFWQF